MRRPNASPRAALIVLGLGLVGAGAGCDVVKKLADKKGAKATSSAEAKQDEPPKPAEAPKPKEGDPCDQDNQAVCRDTGAMLICQGKKWQITTCRGKDGCKGTVVVQCDQTIARSGDPCGKDENYSCTEDLKAQLKCAGGKWQEVAKCRGPKACETKFPFSKCDQSVAREGDACGQDGSAACSEDKKAVFECKGGKYGAKQPCRGGCVAEGIFVKCN